MLELASDVKIIGCVWLFPQAEWRRWTRLEELHRLV
jgi:hypothetical protein